MKIRYEKMTKEQLLNELLDRGITLFNLEDSKSIMIETLYQEDEYENKFPQSIESYPKKNDWQ